MIRSMTGFGQAERSAIGWRCRVELRSLNGRYLDIRLRLPPGLNLLEEQLKKRIKADCERGKFEGSITLAPEEEGGPPIELNKSLLEVYSRILREVRQVLDEPVQVTLGDLMGNRDLIQFKTWENRREAVEKLVQDTLEEALAGLVSMRETEGEALHRALLTHTETLRRLSGEMAPLAKDLPAQYEKKLRENLARLSGGNLPGEERILQEITLFADRCDVTEEFARLGAHLDHLSQLLQSGGAVGRKFEFLLQELNREANTLSVKCSDSNISVRIVEMKSELERLREQVQNIE